MAPKFYLRLGGIFGGCIPTESWSFSSEKSYSPKKLKCPQVAIEWLVIAFSNRSLALLRYKASVIPVIATCGLAGLLLTYLKPWLEQLGVLGNLPRGLGCRVWVEITSSTLI